MTTNITKYLEIPETLPKDFYQNTAYLDQAKEAVEIAQSLVHEISDEGRKIAAADVAAIRKYVKTTNSFSKSTFDRITEKVKAWRGQFTDETKKLESIADGIMQKFDEMEKVYIAKTGDIIRQELAESRKKAEIREEFITRPELKLSLSGWLTPLGKLTLKSRDLIESIVSSEFNQQTTYDNRCNVVKIKCLEQDINPAFDPDVLGEAMFTKSNDVFEAKLQSLIDLEKDRIEKAAERGRQKAEAEKKRAVEAALMAQQAEANRIAREAYLKQQEENRLSDIDIAKQAYKNKRDYQDANQATVKQNLTVQTDGTRLVQYRIVFQARLKYTTTNEQFMEKIKSEVVCSGRALNSIISEEVYDV